MKRFTQNHQIQHIDRRLLRNLARWTILTFGIVLLVFLLQWNTVQASDQSSFRLSRLESATRTLQSRINQLENQIGRLSRGTSSPAPTPSLTTPPSDADESILASDPMFDRLATLVIETRQDMFALQEQVEALERQLNPANLPVENDSL